MLSSLPVSVIYQTDRNIFNTGFYIYAILCERIEIYHSPNKTAYLNGEAVDYTGLVVRAIFNNGATTDVTANCRFSIPEGTPFNGQLMSTVFYGSFSTYILFTVIYPVNIVLTKEPNKTSYNIGERIDYSGAIITCTYSDGSTSDVTNKCTFNPAQNEVVTGDSEFYYEITYPEGSTSISITPTTPITIKKIVGIRIDYVNTTIQSLSSGGEIDPSKIYVIYDYNDGTSETIALNDDELLSLNYDDNGVERKLPKDQKTKITNPKNNISVQYDNGYEELITIPLNEPILEEIEVLDSFIAPPPGEFADETSQSTVELFPMFKLGYSDIKPISVTQFVQGVLYPAYITYGRECANLYFEDAYDNPIGKDVTRSLIPDTNYDVWFINLITGKRDMSLGTVKVPLKFTDVRILHPEPGWGEYIVWGTYNGIEEKITAHGPVLYDAIFATSPISAKLKITKDGNAYWECETGANLLYQGENEVINVPATDLPDDVKNWLKLTTSPSNIISYTNDSITFEYISGGKTSQKTISLNSFTIPPSYNKLKTIYTWGNSQTITRNSQGEDTHTEILHTLCFESDEGTECYYLSTKEKYNFPVVETETTRNIEIENNIVYDNDEPLDVNDFTINKESSNGTTSPVSPEKLTFSMEDTNGNTQQLSVDEKGKLIKENSERVFAEQIAKFYAHLTNEAGETVSGTYDIKVKNQRLQNLIITPPTKLSYSLSDKTINYTGFSAVVEYTNGTTADVTSRVHVSSKDFKYITIDMDDTVTVTYEENGESISGTFQLDLKLDDIVIIYTEPKKNMYRIGEKIDYSGLIILSGSGDIFFVISYVIPLEDCKFSVPPETIVTENTDENVVITYEKWGKTYTFDLELYIIGKDYDKTISYIQLATLPTKLEYTIGDQLDFSGLSVICVYSDNSVVDITDRLTYNVVPGATVNANTPTQIIFTYSEEKSGQFSEYFNITLNIFSYLDVVLPERISYEEGEKLHYANFKTFCHYANGEIVQVRNVSFSPGEGTVIYPNMSTLITATYTEGLYSVSSTFNLFFPEESE